MPEAKQARKILIVDDEPAILKSVKRILTINGFTQVREASDGKKALEIIDADLPDLIILDMNMPEITGYEVIGRLKGNLRTHNIPVIILSGYHTDVQRVAGEPVKNISFLPKPLEGEALIAMIENILGK